MVGVEPPRGRLRLPQYARSTRGGRLRYAVVGTFGPMERPLLRVNDVIAELDIGRTKMHALIWSGELPVVRIGRAIRVRRVDLDNFIQANVSQRRRITAA